MNTLSKQLIYLIILILMPLKQAESFFDDNNEDRIVVSANGYQWAKTNRLIISVDATTYVVSNLTFNAYSKTLYKLSCPHSTSTETYTHSMDKRGTGGLFDWEYSFTISNETDDPTVEQGYPMASEMNWLVKQPINITKSTCKAEYQGLAVFGDSSLTFSVSDLLPLGGSITLPGSHDRTAIFNHLIDMERPTVYGGGSGCIAHCTPLILDLNGDGIQLGEAGTGVEFDLLANGQPLTLQWVAPNQDQAFLALDINHNNLIDNGSELFGNGTQMITTGTDLAPNGFVALAQYDMPELGGNNDGQINLQDDIWPQLKLWLDINANGISEPDEISSLSQSGINAIDTIPRPMNQSDNAGNQLLLWSWAYQPTNQKPKIKVIDVYFKVLSPN